MNNEIIKKLRGSRKKRSKIWEMPLAEFKKLVAESSSIGQILKAFGLLNKGGNSKTVKQRMIEENIDFSHIKLGKSSNKGRKFNVEKTPLNEILIENSTFSRVHLKERLIKENIIEYKCKECGLNSMWNEKPISLQLEHINGVSTDNRIENLCFLCPNCHSQTDTFAGKQNRIKKSFCTICGKEKGKYSKMCRKCRYSKTKKFIISKEELERLIKEKSFTHIGKIFGVSDNAIRKRCKALGINFN